MTARLALQALVFQDGGLLALGANVVNMAVAGVALAYVPYRLWGRSGTNRAAVFVGATLSVFVAACLAVVQLLLSGIPMPVGVLAVAMGLFALMALVEGAITVAVLEALQKLNPGWIQAPTKSGSKALTAVVAAVVLLVTVGILFASANPDGLEKLAEEIGVSEQARTLIETPLADYEAAFVNSSWPAQALAGIIGVLLTVVVCVLLAKLLTRRKA
jgi:cobalt/nickel transport system permease protein